VTDELEKNLTLLLLLPENDSRFVVVTPVIRSTH
jgi:hypothetical protein